MWEYRHSCCRLVDVIGTFGKYDATECNLVLRGGIELGLNKTIATTLNLYGLPLATASHGAFLIQLTTLIVPIIQGIEGVPIPRRIQFSVGLVLAGVVCFTQDGIGVGWGGTSELGDALCVLAAVFYTTYDLRLFEWSKKVKARKLITGKIATQGILSIGQVSLLGTQDSLTYLNTITSPTTDVTIKPYTIILLLAL